MLLSLLKVVEKSVNVSSVTSKTDYLITNTPDSGTSKNKTAIKLGVPIITEDEFMNMVILALSKHLM